MKMLYPDPDASKAFKKTGAYKVNNVMYKFSQ